MHGLRARKRPRNYRSGRSAVEQLEDRQLLSSVALTSQVVADVELISAPQFDARDDTQTISRDSDAVRIEVLQNDIQFLYWGYYSGGQSHDLTVAEILNPVHGSVQFTEDRQAVLYTPDPGFEGVDQFRYTAINSDGEESVAQVFVNVVAPVIAVDDWFQIDTESADNTLDLLRNDQANAALAMLSFGDLTVVSVSALSGDGSIAISDDGQSVIYSPEAGFEGLETFDYTVEDQNGYQTTATVKLRVVPGDRPTDTSSDAWREEVEQLLLEESLAHSAGQFGTPVSNDWGYCGYHYYCLPRVFAADSLTLFSTGVADASTVSFTSELSVVEQDSTFSTTNVQVEGVDEGDLVKTDGEFLYIISNVGGTTPLHEIVLVDVRDQENPAVVSRIAISGQILSQYLQDDRLTVLSRSDDGTFDPESTRSGEGILVTVLDVSDKDSPTVVSETVVEGVLVDSRTIGNFLYLVSSSQTSLQLPELPKPIEVCAEGDSGCFYETKSQFIERVRSEIAVLASEFEIEGTHYASYDATGELIDSGTTEHALSLMHLQVGQSWRNMRSLTTTFAIDVMADSPQVESGTSIVTTNSSDMYASADSIYLFSERGYAESQIHKFDFAEDGGGIEWVASGSVEGQILNQFSVDEHQGYLRVAAHVGNIASGSNTLFVMQQQGEQLEVVSSIENLAPGERIYSVRFMGDRGFVVTFRKVDPLFVMDLSDPLDPQVTGQLKVPGYSNYLQLIDENTLLGIGRNADENSGLFQGLQASLFDLTDMSDPTLIDRYTFEGGRNTWSPVATDAWNLSDHHAVSYFGSHQALAIPIYSNGGWGGNFGGVDNTPIFSDPNHSAVRVLHVDAETGFEELGQVEFDTRATRSVRIGDALYSIAPDTIKVNELLNPENQFGEVVVQEDYVPFQQPWSGGGGTWLGGGVIQILPISPVITQPITPVLTLPPVTITPTILPTPTFTIAPTPDPPTAEVPAENVPEINVRAADAIADSMYDLDGDMVIGFGDLSILTAQFLKSSDSASPLTADFDGSGRVDYGDMSLFSAKMGMRLQTPPGDAFVGPQVPQDAIFLQIGLEDLQQDDRDEP